MYDIGDRVHTSLGNGIVTDYDGVYIYVRISGMGVYQFRKGWGTLEAA